MSLGLIVLLNVCIYPRYLDTLTSANSLNLDQTAPSGAV